MLNADTNATPLLVVAYGIAISLLAESVAYLLIYRTPSFKRLKSSFESYEPSSDGSASNSSKSSKKKELKTRNFEAEAGRKMIVVQLVTGIIVRGWIVEDCRFCC